MTGVGYAGEGLGGLAQNIRKGETSKQKKLKLRPDRTFKDMLAGDIHTMRQDPLALGYSDAEREQMMSEGLEASRANMQAQQSQVSRQALAGQDFQAGAYADAQRNIAEAGQETVADLSRDIMQANLARISQEEQRIRSDLDKQRQIKEDKMRFWSQFGIDGVTGLLESIGGALEWGK